MWGTKMPVHFILDVDNTSVDMVLQKALDAMFNEAAPEVFQAVFAPDLKALLEEVNQKKALQGITILTHQDATTIKNRMNGMDGLLSNNKEQMVEIQKTLAWNIGSLMGEPFANQTTVCLQSDVYPPQNETEPHPVGSTAIKLKAFFESPQKNDHDALDRFCNDIGETVHCCSSRSEINFLFARTRTKGSINCG